MPVSVLRAQGACASVQRGVSFWFLERSLKILTQKTKKNLKKNKTKATKLNSQRKKPPIFRGFCLLVLQSYFAYQNYLSGKLSCQTDSLKQGKSTANPCITPTLPVPLLRLVSISVITEFYFSWVRWKFWYSRRNVKSVWLFMIPETVYCSNMDKVCPLLPSSHIVLKHLQSAKGTKPRPLEFIQSWMKLKCLHNIVEYSANTESPQWVVSSPIKITENRYCVIYFPGSLSKNKNRTQISSKPLSLSCFKTGS